MDEIKLFICFFPVSVQIILLLFRRTSYKRCDNASGYGAWFYFDHWLFKVLDRHTEIGKWSNCSTYFRDDLQIGFAVEGWEPAAEVTRESFIWKEFQKMDLYTNSICVKKSVRTVLDVNS